MQYPLLRQSRPLAAQNEMIDAEQLAVTRDLLLDRDLVADDEAVAGELVERQRLNGCPRAPAASE
jgi:hypothetical protein